MAFFGDRHDAGRRLGEVLARMDIDRPRVLALPRRGVVVGSEVALRLHVPLEVLVVRKLGVPWHPELAMGAVAEHDALVLDHHVIEGVGVTDDEIERILRWETHELARKLKLYRGGLPLPPVRGQNVIIVDDGIATGSTARAAVQAMRHAGARQVILAAPVVAVETASALEHFADGVAFILRPLYVSSLGAYYDDFTEVSDEDVLAILGHREELHAGTG